MAADHLRRDAAWTVGGVLVVAALLRFHGLAGESLWVDEGWTAWLASGSLAQLWHRLGGDVHPPLYPALMHVWSSLAGASETALRLPSAVCGVAAVAAAWQLGRRLVGVSAATFAALIMAVSGFLTFYAQEARSYSLLLLLTVLAMLALERVLERDTPGRCAALAGVDVLLVWTHYFAVFVIAAQWLVWAATGLEGRLGRGRPVLGPRRWLGVQAVVAIGALPLLPLAVQQYLGVPRTFWIPPAGPRTLLETLLLDLGLRSVGGGTVPLGAWAAVTAGLLLALTALALAPAVRRLLELDHEPGPRRRPESVHAVAVLVPWLATPVLLPLLLSWVGLDLLTPRNLIVVTPAVALLLGAAVAWVPHPSGRMLALAGLVALPLAGRLTAPPGPVKEPWREAAAQVRRLEQPGDAFVLDPWFVRPVLEYYLGAAEPSFAPFDPHAVGARRIWLVRSHSRDRGTAPVRFLADRGYRPLGAWSYRGIGVMLLRRSEGAAEEAPTTTTMSRKRGLAKRRSH